MKYAQNCPYPENQPPGWPVLADVQSVVGDNAQFFTTLLSEDTISGVHRSRLDKPGFGPSSE